jgi:hypothetical protein
MRCAPATWSRFPEGTTGPGRELLPFHANLLQAASRPRPRCSRSCCAFTSPASLQRRRRFRRRDDDAAEPVAQWRAPRGLQVERVSARAPRALPQPTARAGSQLRERIDAVLARAG